MYSHRIENLAESATIAISTLAQNLKAQGKDILSFSTGEPDFDTPQCIKEAAIKALQEGFTKYTTVAGILELRKAIAQKLQRENELSYEPSEILVSNGAKQSLFNAFQALIDVGDEVIIPAPYWVTYPELVTYSGGTNVFLSTNESTQFKITPSMLKQAITKKTKMIVLTTPSNPTGMVYTRQEILDIYEVIKDSNIWIISDEMYEKLIFDEKFCSVASINEDMLQRTITVNGLSKSVAMTGWRIGYLASKDKKLIKLMDNLQSQCTSNINSITQKAAITALDGSADQDIEKMRLAFKERRDLAHGLINNIKNLSVMLPQGAFYLFINLSRLPQSDSMQFCKDLLEQEGVALVPGVAFGMEGYARLSFACSKDQILKGIQRIQNFVSRF
ncbi:pyridoxal phosphate-dependent aminotransferase [Helicobacter mustelae]|uniref:Aminotransferase n=1 Tax=Helicobacter mustelae (strain ATCC 43772 / CCUG 25715 / CIP 103759 / LMG 18044 / NCTC 12198 / R85-136P) TaxID=679897 RepID=D3UHN4_HELM1|nr:pyridoxal phosphate-dependent aminotransferase [Helicobacter mustelae]CBG40006.1 aspartate aminotransferase [Helicobacter mustelae 12198]SQH71518.1 aspartate aminotransferase [Helicobacter mustelae]